MQDPAATIYCSNNRCQAPNPQDNKYCQQCRTPLILRYLWAVGEGIKAYTPGEIIADRYQLKLSAIVLDTKPGLPPQIPQEIPNKITPYLRLFPYRLHIPQVYGQLLLRDRGQNSENLVTRIWCYSS